MSYRILIFFLVIVTNYLSGQNNSELQYSVINFVRSGNFVGSGCRYDILLPNQRQFFINPKSVIRYKVYSEGKMNISLDILCATEGLGMQSFLKELNINIKRGKEYYIFISNSIFTEVDNIKVEKYLKRKKRIKELEENIEYPIIKSSLKVLDTKD